MLYCYKKFILCISTYLWRHNFLVLIFAGTKKGRVEVILEHLILIINNLCPCTNWKNKSHLIPLKTIKYFYLIDQNLQNICLVLISCVLLHNNFFQHQEDSPTSYQMELHMWVYFYVLYFAPSSFNQYYFDLCGFIVSLEIR